MKNRITLAAIVILAVLGFFLLGPSHNTSLPASGKVHGDSAVAAKSNSEKPSANAVAQTQTRSKMDPRRLFSVVPRPAYADALERNFRAPSRDIHYVRLNKALLDGKRSPLWLPSGQGKLDIPLPDGTVVHATVDHSVMLDQSRFTSVGSVDGQPASRVLIAGNDDGQYSAAILDLTVGEGANQHLANFAIRATGEEEAQYYEVDDSLVPLCGERIRPQLDEKARQVIAARKAASLQADESTSSSATITEHAVAADETTTPTIDVMMLYTPAVLNKHVGTTTTKQAAVQSTFDLVIAHVNTDFSRSGILAKVRLVRVEMVDYDENGSSSTEINSDALVALFNPADGKMDNVYALRDEVGADLVCLAVGRDTSDNSIGLGYMMETPAIVDTSNAMGNDFFGYTVVNYSYVVSTNVVSHEMGHNFGCQHDRENSDNSPGAYSYSYGYRFNGINSVEYRTIMAYSPGIRVNYFSNPRITASEAGIQVPVGIAVGQTGEADNAQTIQKTAFEVSTYRLQKVSAFHTGRLFGLATRSYVGTGEQQLIGGIAITGGAKKTVLLRASGPVLALAGVAGSLADPKLTVRSVPAGLVVAQNSSWASHASASQVSSAGFTPTYPVECAMILSLDPGAYSAAVESDDGGTGIGMIEAYELANDGDLKLLGIASRGYADNKDYKELIAGIAVTGTAGQPKRVLIRVGGPTLARDAGIGTAMTDPCLELHGSDGSLIFSNDDWASGATIVNGASDDFQPTTSMTINGTVYTLYSGSEISKTGYAPSNRREPALLVDLLPGNYTVIVKPFEYLSSNPDENQPARPGVGMVEVYEISSSGKVF